jgi:hypothetical protein
MKANDGGENQLDDGIARALTGKLTTLDKDQYQSMANTIVQLLCLVVYGSIAAV